MSYSKKLSNNSSSAGPQYVTNSCTESQFIDVFGGYITRHSITRCSYKGIFSGKSAYNLLYQILDDENWGVRNYLQ
ncbi:26036_t:CDS:1, partial [Gigaspora rosea]